MTSGNLRPQTTRQRQIAHVALFFSLDLFAADQMKNRGTSIWRGKEGQEHKWTASTLPQNVENTHECELAEHEPTPPARMKRTVNHHTKREKREEKKEEEEERIGRSSKSQAMEGEKQKKIKTISKAQLERAASFIASTTSSSLSISLLIFFHCSSMVASALAPEEEEAADILCTTIVQKENKNRKSATTKTRMIMFRSKHIGAFVITAAAAAEKSKIPLLPDSSLN